MTANNKKSKKDLISKSLDDLTNNNSSDDLFIDLENKTATAASSENLPDGFDGKTTVETGQQPFQQSFAKPIPVSEKTVVVEDSDISSPAPEKISFGVARPSTRSPGSANAALVDAQVMQAENLRMAQGRLSELEQELEKLRAENEMLSTAQDAAKQLAEELSAKVEKLESDAANLNTQYLSELEVYRDNMAQKDSENMKLKARVDELDARLHQDLRKIRVRERELENRLELAKVEKEALLRTKDDMILDLKRKMESVQFELETYKNKYSEINKKIELQKDQISRTIRALRLALTNLELNDGSGAVTPIKKAE